MTSPSGQAASAFNIGIADRDTHRVAPCSSGRARRHACLYRQYRAIGKIGTPAFFDRGVKGVAIDVGNRQCVKRGMADWRGEPQASHPSRGSATKQGRRNCGTGRSLRLLRTPQPSSTPHPTRIAVNRGEQASNHIVRKDVPPP